MEIESEARGPDFSQLLGFRGLKSEGTTIKVWATSLWRRTIEFSERRIDAGSKQINDHASGDFAHCNKLEFQGG